MNPARSLNARRTNVAAPPVSGSAVTRLGVRERDEQEEQPGDEQHERREAERVQGDDAEREVDRRGDLAVGDREERARVELAAEPGQLAGHALPRPLHVEPRRAGRDEEQAEDDSDLPAAVRERDRDHHDPEHGEEDRELREAACSLMPTWPWRVGRVPVSDTCDKSVPTL